MLKLSRKLEEYILNHTADEEAILKELERETHMKVLRPRMLSGHLQGKLLKMICHMLQPKNVLEIGTYTGYSAISMAQGIPEDGKVYTLEINDELENFTRGFIKKSGQENKIRFRIGDALKIIPQLDIIFDLVFIDGDKRQYLDYYKVIFPKVRPGGFILADDVLWDGKVMENTPIKDLRTEGILAFNDYVHQDIHVENLLLPIRHGLMMLRKK